MMKRAWFFTAVRVVLFVIGFGAFVAATTDVFQGDLSLVGAGLFAVAAEVILDALVCWLQGDRHRALVASIVANVCAWVGVAALIAVLSIWGMYSADSPIAGTALLALAVCVALASSTWAPSAQAITAFLLMGLTAPALGNMGWMDLGWPVAVSAYALWVLAVGPLALLGRTAWSQRHDRPRRGVKQVGVVLTAYLFACVVSLSAVFAGAWYLSALNEIAIPGPVITVNALRTIANDYSRNVTASQALTADPEAVNELARLSAVSGVSLTVLDRATHRVVLAVRPIARDSSGMVVNEMAETPPDPALRRIEAVRISGPEREAIVAGLNDHRRVLAEPMALAGSIALTSAVEPGRAAGYPLADSWAPSNSALLLVASTQDADWWTLPQGSPAQSAAEVTGWIAPLLMLALLLPASWTLWWLARGIRTPGPNDAPREQSIRTRHPAMADC